MASNSSKWPQIPLIWPNTPQYGPITPILPNPVPTPYPPHTDPAPTLPGTTRAHAVPTRARAGADALLGVTGPGRGASLSTHRCRVFTGQQRAGPDWATNLASKGT